MPGEAEDGWERQRGFATEDVEVLPWDGAANPDSSAFVREASNPRGNSLRSYDNSLVGRCDLAFGFWTQRIGASRLE
jgi:hypothetical protein